MEKSVCKWNHHYDTADFVIHSSVFGRLLVGTIIMKRSFSHRAGGRRPRGAVLATPALSCALMCQDPVKDLDAHREALDVKDQHLPFVEKKERLTTQ